MHHGKDTAAAILGGSPIEAGQDNSLLATGVVVKPFLSRSCVLWPAMAKKPS